MLPSRILLHQQMDSRFATLQSSGISSLGDLLRRLGTLSKLEAFSGVSGLAIILLISFYRDYAQDSETTKLALVLVLAGALGNIIDRIRFGVVIDFIDVHWYEYHWPAFNVADCAISVGVTILLLDALINMRKLQ